MLVTVAMQIKQEALATTSRKNGYNIRLCVQNNRSQLSNLFDPIRPKPNPMNPVCVKAVPAC